MARILALALALLALMPTGARAEWMEASSDHFVIYADQSEKTLYHFAHQLERYHAAMALMTNVKQDAPSPSSRVTVFVLDSQSDVRQQYAALHGRKSRYVAGFYHPRAGGSVAMVSRVRASGVKIDFSMTALLHEYAHHFLISGSSASMSRWFSEGGAEYFASASFYPDGSVGIGQPAQHRAAELSFANDVSAEELLDPDAYQANRSKGYDAFYGKSWLLYHYLATEPARRGQLPKYVSAVAAGKGQRQAALDAFGDFKTLESELDKYLNRSRVTAFKISADKLGVGTIRMRRLSEGEAAIMPVLIQSKRGVNSEQAQEVAQEARAVAARFPADAAVLAALAEAEYDAGNDEAAIAAADKALAIDPRRVNAYVQKGYAQFRMAGDAADPAAAYRKARDTFVALNRLENDHPLPLIYYYRSFVEQGQTPSKLAVEALKRAVELAPFDSSLRMTLATQQLRDQDREGARRNLTLLAADPHGRGSAELAEKMVARMEAEPDWDGTGIEQMGTADEDADAEEEPAAILPS